MPEQISQFLDENATDSILSTRTFVVADQRTAEDSTLLLVDLGSDGFDMVRVSASQVNVQATCVWVATTSVNELRSIADGDGIFRGGGGPEPKRGGAAPRKQLASRDSRQE